MGKKLTLDDFNDEDFGNLDDCILSDLLVESGIEIEVGPDKYMTVRPSTVHNRQYQARAAENYMAYKDEVDSDTMDEGTSRALLFHLFADTVVLDWRGFTKADGTPKPYSKKALISVLMRSEIIWMSLKSKSDDLASFTVEAEKNLGND